MKSKIVARKRPLASNPFIRITGYDAAASQVLALARSQALLPVQILATSQPTEADYTQIDMELSIAPPTDPILTPAPQPGLGYGGLTPAQRHLFLNWLDDPTAPAAPAFQQLYVTHLEIRLFEAPAQAQAAQQEIQRLQRTPAWQQSEALARAYLLTYWLTQDGAGLAGWIAEGTVPPSLLGMAVGWQALLQTPLHTDEVMVLAQGWQIPTNGASPAVINLRLNSLTASLGAEPLTYALTQVGEAAMQAKLWRGVHRDLRLMMPQPNLRAVLAPLLTELLTSMETSATETSLADAPSNGDEPGIMDLGWHLILEFGHSRSEFFEFALELAQRMETYTQLTDESRKLVHRVVFKKGDIRRFWRLWDYVQSWANTRVYLNGEELEKWKIFPYSQYMR